MVSLCFLLVSGAPGQLQVSWMSCTQSHVWSPQQSIQSLCALSPVSPWFHPSVIPNPERALPATPASLGLAKETGLFESVFVLSKVTEAGYLSGLTFGGFWDPSWDEDWKHPMAPGGEAVWDTSWHSASEDHPPDDPWAHSLLHGRHETPLKIQH